MATQPPTPPTPVSTIYVNYFDSINASKIKALMAICSDIVAKNKPDVIYFLFSSVGGEVNAGIALYNFLRALPVEIVMHNCGVDRFYCQRDLLGGLQTVRGEALQFLVPRHQLELRGGSISDVLSTERKPQQL
jgi:hypothetical protein